jgi:hypothetical protein
MTIGENKKGKEDKDEGIAHLWKNKRW